MRVKEIDRTANVVWSPQPQHPIYLAAGTAAQQLDATFSTSAALEIYTLDLAEAGLEMEMAGSIPSDQRFHKLVWGSHGMETEGLPSGVLVGGADHGNLFVWNPAKIVKSEDALLYKLQKHTGAVQALDLNPFQKNLLASGGSESEIFIWDLNKTSTPMEPGTKSQPPDDVTCVAWNQQVQHILASTYAGRCVVWDLRKNEPIIKVSDSMSRIKCKLVAWHPDVATQLCLSSEDDHTPVIQLWDLRFATSPLKQLESHTRGVLSMAWCANDPDLLLSCGKDNRILCWNPNSAAQTGEVVYELPTSNQWCFDVQWCPRNPSIISSCSFDSHVSVYSLMGGGPPPAPPSRVADAFPTDPFAKAPAQTPAHAHEAPVVLLKKPPKWMRRPVGASFTFGGRLVTFENVKAAQPQQQVPRLVYTSQVITETELVSRSQQLEQALSQGQMEDFCNMKVANSKNDIEENIWNFMKVHFEKDPRARYLQLLGYDRADLVRKVTPAGDAQGDEAALSGRLANLNTEATGEDVVSGCQEPASLATDQSGDGDGSSAFDQIAQSEQDEARSDSPLPFDTTDECDGLITQAVVIGNFEAAVEVCLKHGRMAEAILLAIAGGPELLGRTQKKFFAKNRSNLNRLLASLVSHDLESVVRTCSLDNWRDALAVAITYSKPQELPLLCDILGSRLESERRGDLAANACLCYITAGNVTRLLECWNRLQPSETPAALQDLVEKVMTLQKAREVGAGRAQEVDSQVLAEKLSRYSELLAAQGALHTALGYLGTSNELSLALLRDRLYTTLGAGAQGMPARPFRVINVQPQRDQPASQQAAGSAHTRMHQTQAGSFATATTPSSSYSHTAAASAYPAAHAQPASVQNYPQPAVSAASSRPRYPSASYPGQPGVSSDPYAQFNQPTPGTPSYGNTGGYGAGGNFFNPQSATAQPQQQVPGVVGFSSSWNSGKRRGSLFGMVQEGRRTFVERGAPYTPAAPPVQPAAPPAVAPLQPTQPSFQEAKPVRAWNDPPIVPHKPKAPATSYETPAPISQPIFNPAAMQQEQVPPGAPQQFTNLYNPGQFQQPQPHQPPQPQAPAQPAAQQAPEPSRPVEKGPVPAEHLVLQEVLEKLTRQCLERSVNPQVKRKLEDVLRKLEILYDKLRAQALSESVTTGLHHIIQCIQSYDYNTGLAYHTQLVSQGNFSEISSFMPAVKTVMQTASQLQVYVQ